MKKLTKKEMREKKKKYMREYYATHPEYRNYLSKLMKQNHKANPERTKAIRIKYNHSVKGKLVQKRYREQSKVKKRIKEWKKINQEKVNECARKYYKDNLQRRRKSHKQWRDNNPDRIKEYYKKRELSNKGKEYRKNYYYNNLQKIKKKQKQYYIKNAEKIKKYVKEWQKENPRSSHKYPIDVQDAMNSVGNRDHWTCKWYGCGLTHRQAPIHVHHIFPRSEYPDYELIEEYMICYCLNHHVMFHFYRGDGYDKLLNSHITKNANHIINEDL